MKQIIIIVAFLFTNSFYSKAVDGYKIKLHIDNTDSNKLYFGYYYGSETNLIKVDSFITTPSIFTTTIIKHEKKIVGGMYIFWFKDKSTQLDFLINNGDDFEMSFDKLNPLKTISYIKSDENNAYANCQRENQKLNLPMEIARKNVKGANNFADSIKYIKQIRDAEAEIEANNDVFVKKYPNSIAAIYLKILDDYKSYSMDNFWDKYPLNDDRIILTPMQDKMLTRLFKIFPEDSKIINPKLDKFLDKAESNKNIFKYSLWWISNKLEKRNNEELELVYLNILEKYYLSGKASWLDSVKIFPYKDAAKNIRKIMVGDIAPEISLTDMDEKPHNLSDFCKEHDYNLLIMWSPTCPHCKKQLPIIDSEITQLAKKINIKIFAIQNDNDDMNWKSFINFNKLHNSNWLHLHSTDISPIYRSQYNTYTNPRMFLLDKNRKVLSKYITSENLEKIMNKLTY